MAQKTNTTTTKNNHDELKEVLVLMNQILEQLKVLESKMNGGF